MEIVGGQNVPAGSLPGSPTTVTDGCRGFNTRSLTGTDVFSSMNLVLNRSCPCSELVLFSGHFGRRWDAVSQYVQLCPVFRWLQGHRWFRKVDSFDLVTSTCRKRPRRRWMRITSTEDGRVQSRSWTQSPASRFPCLFVPETPGHSADYISACLWTGDLLLTRN